MTRRLGFCALLVAAALLSAPGAAAADVVFDQADADELADTLADAHDAQGVCYGWSVDVSDAEGTSGRSVGSNFGAGKPVSGGDCSATVEFLATITWTSESSDAEDSVSYEVRSSPRGPTTDDLDDLDIISDDGLLGDDSDADVYKAVAALPLLAADNGIAKPIEASPAPAAEAKGEPTNSPGSDFWRQSGMELLWGGLLVLAAIVFAVYAIRSSRRTRRRPVLLGPAAERIPDDVPDYVPSSWSDTPPPTGPPVAAEPPPGDEPPEPVEPPEPPDPKSPPEE